jgi:hypothetical protein
VLLQQRRENKLSSTFREEPLQVVARHGQTVYAETLDGNTVERNVSYFKPFQRPEVCPIPQKVVTSHLPATSPVKSGKTSPQHDIVPTDNIHNQTGNSSCLHSQELPNIMPVKRSQRTVRPPDWLKDYVID